MRFDMVIDNFSDFDSCYGAQSTAIEHNNHLDIATPDFHYRESIKLEVSAQYPFNSADGS